MNKSHIAHIVADSADGPRGDKLRSPQLAKDIRNLMLMCRDCHSRIDDKNGWPSRPEDLLLTFKKEHEDRITHVTSFDSDHVIHWIFYTVKIGDRKPVPHVEEAMKAIIKSGFYPQTSNPIFIDGTDLSITDSDPLFWQIYGAELQKRIDNFMDQEFRRSSCKRVALFGIAPIALLAKVGAVLGQMVELRSFQLHRDMETWSWQTGSATTDFLTNKTTEGTAPTRVALSVSITGQVELAAMKKAIGSDFVHYAIKSRAFDPCAIKTEGDLQKFKEVYLQTLASLGADNVDIHQIAVFAAVPVSVAVEMGRQKIPKAHPQFQFYDYKNGAFTEALTV